MQKSQVSGWWFLCDGSRRCGNEGVRLGGRLQPELVEHGDRCGGSYGVRRWWSLDLEMVG